MEKKSKEIIEKLKLLQPYEDTESAHLEADSLLCELLEELGFKNVVDEWNKVHKWYA